MFTSNIIHMGVSPKSFFWMRGGSSLIGAIVILENFRETDIILNHKDG